MYLPLPPAILINAYKSFQTRLCLYKQPVVTRKNCNTDWKVMASQQFLQCRKPFRIPNPNKKLKKHGTFFSTSMHAVLLFTTNTRSKIMEKQDFVPFHPWQGCRAEENKEMDLGEKKISSRPE